MRTVLLERTDIYKGPLILVNKEYPIVEYQDSGSVQLTAVDTEHKDILLETRAAILLSHLLKSIDRNNEIIPVSGYRTYEEQVKLYVDSLTENGREFTEKYVALPDRSEHQTGLAIDLSINMAEIDFIRPDFPYTGIGGCFRLAAVKYGFIERYGKGKEAVTGIAHEPWHFRYVGHPHAQIMESNHLSLEEYVTFIKAYPYSGKHLQVNEPGKDIEVFYVEAASEIIKVELPGKGCVLVSGNNADGFIISYWRL